MLVANPAAFLSDFQQNNQATPIRRELLAKFGLAGPPPVDLGPTEGRIAARFNFGGATTAKIWRQWQFAGRLIESTHWLPAGRLGTTC